MKERNVPSRVRVVNHHHHLCVDDNDATMGIMDENRDNVGLNVL